LLTNLGFTLEFKQGKLEIIIFFIQVFELPYLSRLSVFFAINVSWQGIFPHPTQPYTLSLPL
jgi:hypothetical protein